MDARKGVSASADLRYIHNIKENKINKLYITMVCRDGQSRLWGRIT